MTPEELAKIPFKFQSHLAMANRHSTTYKADGVPFTLLMCVSSPAEDYETGEKAPGRTTRHFLLDGKLYKSKKALYKALESYDAPRPMSKSGDMAADKE